MSKAICSDLESRPVILSASIDSNVKNRLLELVSCTFIPFCTMTLASAIRPSISAFVTTSRLATCRYARTVVARSPDVTMLPARTATSSMSRFGPGRAALHATRTFSSGVDVSPSTSDAQLSSPKLEALYGDITKLTVDEVNILGALVLQILGRTIFPGQFGHGMDGIQAVDSVGQAPVEEEVVVKTAFTVKLVGFDEKAKIKVIKEVRAIAGLGLKEAKELVESCPKVIQKDVKQDKADELKAQLEAVGAQIVIE